MRWTNRLGGAALSSLAALVTGSAILLSGAAPEKRLSVYSVAGP